MDLTFPAALIVAGFSGFFASMMGVGGGFLNVPTLTLFFSLDPATAIGTSLLVIMVTAISGSAGYAKQKRIFYRSALFLAVPAIIGAFIGAELTRFFSPAALGMIFAVVLFLVALRLVFPWIPFVTSLSFGPSFRESCTDCFGRCVTMRMYPVHLVAWGLFGGVLGGMTGTGGGIINVPALLAVGMPIHYAIATSTLVIALSSGSAAAVHAGLSHLSLTYGIIYAVGGILGAQAGSRLAPGVSPRTLHLMVIVLYFLLAGAMAISSLMLLL